MRIISLSIATILTAGLLAGCSTSSVVHQPYTAPAGQTYTYEIERRDMTFAGMEMLEQSLDRRLAEAGLDGGRDPAMIEIRIREYFMRDGTARIMGGVFAGRDRIISDVRVLSSSGEVAGEFVVESTNATAMGTSAGLVDRHAQEIVGLLLGADQ